MPTGNVIVRFENVTFGYESEKLQLDEACFSVRENSKITIMGQNGAGKSTMFKVMTRELQPKFGNGHIDKSATIGIVKWTQSSRQ